MMRPRLNALIYATFLEELTSGPCTLIALQEATGLHYRSISGLLRVLHKRGLVHICGWEKDSIGRVAIAVWAFGPGKDAPRQKKSKLQVQRDWRNKKTRAEMTTALAG